MLPSNIPVYNFKYYMKNSSMYNEHLYLKIFLTNPFIKTNPLAFHQASLTIHWYPFEFLSRKRHHDSKVFWPRTQHNDTARSKNWTSWLRVQYTNHWNHSSPIDNHRLVLKMKNELNPWPPSNKQWHEHEPQQTEQLSLRFHIQKKAVSYFETYRWRSRIFLSEM